MSISKLIFLLPTLLPSLFIATASPLSFTQSSPHPSTDHVLTTPSYPNRTLAGVTVIDTPSSAPPKHVPARTPATSSTTTPDRRFEIDGAIASRDFLSEHQHNHTNEFDNAGRAVWDHRRTQLVWDAIALHTTASISQYKEAEVRVVGQGIMMDFQGPQLGVTAAEYAAVVARFPQTGFGAGVNETTVWLCATKPETTYDTFMQPFGEHYVANYSAEGHRAFDLITALPN
ncbi:hypothetical protein PG997_008606 [Apiospora hydei]|uniref:Uncharacterized protein n=1 Tax=Apiospora hydei TaxID=1337664 RepID=A0ABR1WBB1_9PEZI